MAIMRNLVTVLCVGFLGVGCGSNGPAGGSGQVQFTWSLQDQSGAPIACAAGETVRLTAGSTAFVFNCTDMAGQTGLIRSATYDLLVQLLDSSNTVESMATIPGVGVFNGRITDAGHVLFVVNANSTGSVGFTWEIRSQATNQPATCGPGRQIVYDFGGGVTPRADCPSSSTSGQSVLQDIAVGNYSVVASLVVGSTVESMTPSPVSVTVVDSQTADGGHIVFLTAP
jgi:hypothetical protein